MKYYVYISDAKVDMLLPQIPSTLKKKISKEFKIDLKILSASRKSEVEVSENRISRLEAVCQYIRDNTDVGSVNDPGEYIFDTLQMRFRTGYRLAFFGSFTGKTYVALGGSLKHMIGESPQSDGRHLSSELSGILAEVLQVDEPYTASREALLRERFDSAENVLRWLKNVIIELPPIEQRLEFLAKTFLWRNQVVIASPLYIALADEPRGLNI